MLYLVLRQDEGVRVAGAWNGLGMRGNDSAPMTLRDVNITVDRALSAPGKGLDMALGVVLPVFNLGNAAISVGIAEAAVQSTQQHITKSTLEHLGQTLADIPLERARLAQMRIETDRARSYLVSTLDAVESSDPAAMISVLGVKAAAAETAAQVTDTGMRACGGTGFGKHLTIERNFRDARAALVMGPTSDLIQESIGRALCGMELF